MCVCVDTFIINLRRRKKTHPFCKCNKKKAKPHQLPHPAPPTKKVLHSRVDCGYKLIKSKKKTTIFRVRTKTSLRWLTESMGLSLSLPGALYVSLRGRALCCKPLFAAPVGASDLLRKPRTIIATATSRAFSLSHRSLCLFLFSPRATALHTVAPFYSSAPPRTLQTTNLPRWAALSLGTRLLALLLLPLLHRACGPLVGPPGTPFLRGTLCKTVHCFVSVPGLQFELVCVCV